MKKIVAILLSFVLVFGLAACGGGEVQQGSTHGGTDTTDALAETVFNSNRVKSTSARRFTEKRAQH